jgi:hypothetical protein
MAYGYSANVLAVRMAEIFGGHHIALSPVWPKTVNEQYQRAVEDIDLLICGAGTRSGLFFSWYKEQLGFDLPQSVVGDICLVPISRQGRQERLDQNGAELVGSHLKPKPTYEELLALATKNRTVLVLVDQPGKSGMACKEGDGGPQQSKVEVARAILERCLTRTCVLGASLGQRLLR